MSNSIFRNLTSRECLECGWVELHSRVYETLKQEECESKELKKGVELRNCEQLEF